MDSASFDFLPIWAVFPLTLIVGLLAVEVGSRIARHRKQRSKENVEAPAVPIVAATLGLLAFMLAFTFGIAAARFEERRQAVLLDSNAISTAYLRAEMLPEPMAANARNLLREYVAVRLDGASKPNPAKTMEAISKSEELHKRLWAEAVSAGQKERSVFISAFMQSLIDVINLHEKRSMAVFSRIPAAIWLGLYSLLVLALAVLGYHEGTSGTRRSLAVVGLVLAFSAVLVLITDLERPGQGMLRVSQQSMLNVQKSMTPSSTR